jgi:hypothetical protein
LGPCPLAVVHLSPGMTTAEATAATPIAKGTSAGVSTGLLWERTQFGGRGSCNKNGALSNIQCYTIT